MHHRAINQDGGCNSRRLTRIDEPCLAKMPSGYNKGMILALGGSFERVLYGGKVHSFAADRHDFGDAKPASARRAHFAQGPFSTLS